MSDLDSAVQLIRQGNMAQAQKYLEVIVRSEPNNIPAWLWYAQTFPSDEARLKVLVASMKFNPGDEKILQAIRLVRGKGTTPQNASTLAPASPLISQSPPPKSVEEMEIEIPPIFAQIQAEQEQAAQEKSAFNWDELEQGQAPATPVHAVQAQQASSGSAFNWDELEQNSSPSSGFKPQVQSGESKSAFNWDEIDPEPSPATPAFASQTQSSSSKSAFNWDEFEQKSAPAAQASTADTLFTDQPESIAPEVKAPAHSYKFYEVWWTALTNQKVEAYADLLEDPHAGIGRALEWQIYTNLILLFLGGLVGYFRLQSLTQLPDFQKLQQQSPMFASLMTQSMFLVFLLVFVVAGLMLGILGLLISGAFQNFLAHMFGGTGNFSRTVYALSAYAVPISIAATVMSYIPLVNCATIAVTGYSLVLNVRALQAAHKLNGGRATIIVAIPSILLLMLLCIGFIVISSWIKSTLPSLNLPN